MNTKIKSTTIKLDENLIEEINEFRELSKTLTEFKVTGETWDEYHKICEERTYLAFRISSKLALRVDWSPLEPG